MGATGVGKSTLGNQLFGGKKVFGVGHGSESETATIQMESERFIGTGDCITVIDTPGILDTDGKYFLCFPSN